VIGIFKNIHPSNNFILFIYGLALRWASFINPQAPEIQKDDPYLFRLVAEAMIGLFSFNPYVYSFFLFFLIFILAVFVNRLINAQKLFHRPNDFAGMCLMLFTAVMPGWDAFNSGFLLSCLLAGIVLILLSMSSNNDARAKSFNIGFLLGIAMLIYTPAFLFLFLLLIGLIILRPFRAQEWALIFLGISTPVYFMLSFLFLSDVPFSVLNPIFTVGLAKMSFPLYNTLGASLIFILMLIGFGFSQSNQRKLLVQSRNCWSTLFVYTVISLILPFFNTHSFSTTLMPVLISGSIFGAAAFYYPERKWLSVLSHLLLWVSAITNGYFSLFH
jgi:hypothetical protein